MQKKKELKVQNMAPAIGVVVKIGVRLVPVSSKKLQDLGRRESGRVFGFRLAVIFHVVIDILAFVLYIHQQIHKYWIAIWKVSFSNTSKMNSLYSKIGCTICNEVLLNIQTVHGKRYSFQYMVDSRETHLHRPWELYDPDDTHREQPHIDEEVRMKLLYAFSKLEQSGRKYQDYYGVQLINDLTLKTSFIKGLPVLCLKVMQFRLESNSYKSLEALRHDIQVMLSILEAFIGRNPESSANLKCLSYWFTKNLSSSSL